MLLFVQFLREIELARVWLASPRQGHPHDFLESVPLRKAPSYRSVDFGAVRPVMSENFVAYCDAFYALLSHLQNACTGTTMTNFLGFCVKCKSFWTCLHMSCVDRPGGGRVKLLFFTVKLGNGAVDLDE